ncbi:MAG: hypothetical protein LBR50_01710 [Tannerella sp.]|jgi:hypothetical protein|nr:hypothetical protein [Tannerella sp.]
MKSKFSLQRIGLLIRADYIEQKRGFLLSMGIIFLVWIFLLWLTYGLGSSSDDAMQKLFLFTGSFCTLILFCRLAGNKLHRSKGMFLTLPANNTEKYTALLLDCVIFYAGFQVVYWAGIALGKIFMPSMPLIEITVNNGSGFGETLLFLLASFIFLSYMTFRKYAFLKVVGWMISFEFIFLVTFVNFLKYSGVADRIKPSLIEGDQAVNNLERVITDGMPELLTWSVWSFAIASVIVLYIAFLKLKEKELR